MILLTVTENCTCFSRSTGVCHLDMLLLYLKASHTRRCRWSDNCPHTESIQFNVRASSIQPLRLRRTTTPGTWFNSGIGRTPLNTTNGFNLRPSAIAARSKVKRPLSCPVFLIDTVRSPTLEMVVPGHV